jgi:DNA-directed RNA polymerase specialized sigma24 family protein
LDAQESQRVAKEVFLQVDQAIVEVKSDTPLAAWLQHITVARCLTWQRRWVRRFNWRRDVRDRPKPDPLKTGPTRQWIEGALKRLPDPNRVVYVLNVLEDLPCNEIAKITGLGAESVQHRLDHTRSKLSAMAKPFTAEDEKTDASSCRHAKEMIYRNMDGDLGDTEKSEFEAHLRSCSACRKQARNLFSIESGVRDHVKITADQVDFTDLEKAVLYSARDQRLHGRRAGTLRRVMMFAIPAVVIAGLLVLFVF